ncbi:MULTISPECIES: hypothetical protein [unclassified Streptomyces]|nr:MULTISPECIES: hypothetical protein [unclassified Streptomyces]
MRTTEPLLRRLRSGVEAGADVPGPADPEPGAVRVRAEGEGP